MSLECPYFPDISDFFCQRGCGIFFWPKRLLDFFKSVFDLFWLCGFSAVSMRFLCGCYAVAMQLLCGCFAVVMRLLWGC